jgi:DNA-binding NarL/FixJ family response regulator
MPSYSVAICEDCPALRKEFESLVLSSGRYELAGSFAYGQEMVDLLGQVKVDLLLLDLQLPDMHGTDVLRHMQRLQPRCEAMVVTVFGDEANVLGAIAAGASGYVLKDEPGARLLALMDELLAGGSPITPSIARLMLRRLQDTTGGATETHSLVSGTWFGGLPSGLPFNWTQREDEILTRVAKGYSVQEVADLLELSANTVKTHVRRIYKKLGVSSRSEAVHEAHALGLLDRAPADTVRPRAAS